VIDWIGSVTTTNSTPIKTQAFRRREILELARRNPYSYTLKPRLGTALQLLEATEYVTRRMSDFTQPFLVLQGLADVVTDPKLAKEFHDRAASEVGGWVGWVELVDDLMLY
jgi:alpha-beta hydrolase superfamily lysophospholipase